MNKNKLRGVWIESIFFELEDLNINDIVIVSIIYEMSKNNNICYATNGYFARLIKKSPDTIRKSISKLEQLELITNNVNYNYASNRVLTISQKLNDLLKKGTGTLVKTSKGVLKNNRGTLVKTSNNNIENKKYITSTTTAEILNDNIDLLKSISEDKGISIDIIKEQIKKFAEYKSSIKENTWENESDLCKNFRSWIDKRKINDLEDDTNVNWFIEHFNMITKKDFKVTNEVRELFNIQLKNGFTGSQMLQAVDNMHSNHEENKFHKNSAFKFATPSYILKKDNLNTYLNVRWSTKRFYAHKTIKERGKG